MIDFFDKKLNHYNTVWNNSPHIYMFDRGPYEALNYNFRVLEYPPTSERNMWTYATIGMSDHLKGDDMAIELHIFSIDQDQTLIELLTSIAYFHKKNNKLGLDHTLNFGKPWQKDSLCSFGLISLPYLDGPQLESMPDLEYPKFYWIVPITEEEVKYKEKFGVEALEEKFEKGELDYLNPNRESVV